MPILRLSAQRMDGLVIDLDQATAVAMMGSSEGIHLIADRMLGLRALGQCTLERMSPGRTEITPPSFSQHSSRHFVDVRLGGESATYRMIPRRAAQQVVEHLIMPEGHIELPLDGSMSVRIPDESPVVPLLGQDDAGLARIHEMILYTPRQ